MRIMFFKVEVIHAIITTALDINDEKDPSEKKLELFDHLCKLLSTLSSIKSNKFYIPGETSSTDILRKYSMERGLYTCLSLLYHGSKVSKDQNLLSADPSANILHGEMSL
jgi:hypothetical protein